MSTINFLFSGVPAQYRRETYRQDEVRAKDSSSYQYGGKVTKVENTSSFKKVEIDNSVELFTLSDEQRKNAQSKINQMFWTSLLLTVGGVGGTGYTSYRILKTGEDSPQTTNWLAFGALIISSVWTASKVFEANDEYNKWEDPTESVCTGRRDNSQNFNQLRNLKLRNVLYTSDETKDVFFRTLGHCIDKFESSKRSGSPEEVRTQIAQTFKNCPLTTTNLAYAFTGNVLFNPKKPHIKWDTSDVKTLAAKWEDLSDDYLKLNADVSIKLGDIENNDLAASSAIFGAGRVGNEVIRRNHDSQLKQARTQRERQEIESQRASNHQSAALVEVLAQGGMSVYTTIKEDQLRRETNRVVVDYISPKITSIFRDLQNLVKEEYI